MSNHLTEITLPLPMKCYTDAKLLLGETDELRAHSISTILDWLDANPAINANREITSILYFLRGSKFDLDKAKRKIEKFYLMRAERIEWFFERNPFAPEIQELLDLGIFLPLKHNDDEMRKVVIIRVAAHDPKKHLQNNVFKTGKMILDLALHMDEAASVYGLVAIFDMRNVTLSHALQLPPQLIKRAVESWESYPVRVKKLEFINAPLYVNAVLNTFRMFMSAKLKSRIFVTRRLSTVSVKLPKELGGSESSYDKLGLEWKHLVEENAAWYKEMGQYKSVI